ncbi:MAG: ATP-binding protein [Gaiellaceae bacterium]
MVRKTVTVLFADVTGSTALGERLDPEALRSVMTRYFESARAILERHGGTVEKFIGDAVMAVFGVPVAHEDDALRAARAAVELRDADLGVALRIGVNTGEVVAADGETLVTGDAVNVAARLEQAAAPGEILLGDATYRFARNAIRVHAHDAIDAKGKSEPVSVWTLVEVLDDAPAFTRRFDAPFVGREGELAQLRAAFDRAVSGRRSELVTLFGAAGIGKSRLARELVQDIGENARVVVGRCLAYGEGITYWPLAEIVRATAGSDREAIHAVAGDDVVADRIAAVIGFGGEAGTKEETQWAARRYLEALAADKPLVVVLDDLHWAEPTFLDLVEYVADFAAAPILLLGTARPDLLESRPAWTSPRPNATVLVLEPLAPADCAALLEGIDDETRTRILATAEGNPLFVEQLVAMRAEGGGDFVPPTITALLAARIDSLGPAERAVVERASVEGRLFHRGSVAELSPEDVRPDVGAHLLALVRKQFVRPDRAQLPGDDAYRFAHILIRDAAYEATSKQLRADLHERFVAWFERVAGQHVREFEEIVGYHLEQAALYLRELGLDADVVAQRAAQRLAASGERAYDQGDLPAAQNLLMRALGLLQRGDPLRLRLLPLVGWTLYSLGELGRSRTLLAAAQEEASEVQDSAASIHVWACEAVMLLVSDPGVDGASIEREVAQVLGRIDEFDDPRVAVALYRLEAFASLLKAQWRRALPIGERLRAVSLAAGDSRTASDALHFIAGALIFGPATADEMAEAVERFRREPLSPVEILSVLVIEATLDTYHGNLERARETFEYVRAQHFEFAHPTFAAVAYMVLGGLLLEVGDADAAEHVLRQGADDFRELSETGYLSTQLGLLADALFRLGRLKEAKDVVAEAEHLTQAGDVTSETLWRAVSAKILAREGDLEEAERRARKAIAVVEASDATLQIGDAYAAFADVLELAGRASEARDAREHALALYRQKGHRVLVERTQALLAETASSA